MNSDITKIFQTETTKAAIEGYVQSNIPKAAKSMYMEYVPTVAGRLQSICNTWFAYMKIAAEEKKYRHVFHSTDNVLKMLDINFIGSPSLDEPALGVIQRCFMQLRITAELSCKGGYLYKNFLGEFLPIPSDYVITFHWSPENPYVYKQTVELEKQFHYDPRKNSLIHYQNAIEGKGTNVSLACATGEKVSLHYLYLKNYITDLYAVFGPEVSDEGTKSLRLQSSRTTLRNVQQFIYLNTLEPSVQGDLVKLIDLICAAHELSCKDLYDHCHDLLKECLQSHSKLDATTILGVLARIARIPDQTLLLPFLMSAETLEAEAETLQNAVTTTYRVDWSFLKGEDMVRLMNVAAEHSLGITKKRLQDALIAVFQQPSRRVA